MPKLYARYKWESAYPELWPDYGWCPSINPYGITTLYDMGGQNNHGTLNNFTLSTAWANPVDNGLVASGAQYVDLGRQQWLETATRFSWSVWFKRSSLNAKIELGKNKASSPTNTTCCAFEAWTDGLIYLELTSSTPPFASFPSNDTQWHHVVFNCDLSQATNATKLVCFFDGFPQALSFTGILPSGPTAGDGSLYMHQFLSGFNNWSNGSIDDFAMRRLPYSPGDVALLYSGGYGRGIVYTPRQQTIFGSQVTGNRRRRVIIGAA